MARGIIAVLSIALTVFALADCVQTEDEKIKGLPKWAWIVLIVLIPWVGPITWLFVGRERSIGGGTQRRRGLRAPDEEPDFLRRLDEDIRRERRERRERGLDEDGGEAWHRPARRRTPRAAAPVRISAAAPGGARSHRRRAPGSQPGVGVQAVDHRVDDGVVEHHGHEARQGEPGGAAAAEPAGRAGVEVGRV